ncbi:MAG: DNA polymerase III subunit alpha, partial [Treponema sp.]|nr:DNA polymerase III subunit alpha [Treponema sp.]
LGEGKSFEVFQFESDGMQNILKQTKPTSIEDLTALNAMYRPGPMQNIPRFVESKSGRQPISYPDPKLEGVLKETYGVIVYQEQVMEVARIIAGYSMGQADLLRRAMGKKKKEILDKEKVPFIEGAVNQGYTKRKATEIYDMLIPFADYGFNKSHAAAYSVLAYQTAYLKANFPAEFMAANLTNEIRSADKNKLSHCIDEARKMGIAVDPPDINSSGKLFTVVNGRVVYGFLGIKGFGEAPSDEIVRGRKDGPYKSFIDFLNRVDIRVVGKKGIELLVQTGAFDSFSITRETMAGNLEKIVEYALKKKEDKLLGQTSLFEDSGISGMSDFKFEDYPPMSREDRLNLEKQLIGFYFSGHPMDEYKEIWQKAVSVDLGKEDLKAGNCVLVGIVKNIKTITASRGGKMAFAVLSDYNGEIEVTFFPGVWERCQNVIEPDKVAILKGKIDYQKDKDKYSFIAENIVNRQDIDAVIREVKSLEDKFMVHRNTWVYMADLKSGFLTRAKKGSYTIIGYLKSLREFKDKNDNDMAFGTLQDFEGEIDLVFFSKVYAENRYLLKLDDIIALKGNIDPENERNPEKISFKVSSIADFAQLSRSAARREAKGEKPPETEFEKPAETQAGEVHIKLNTETAGSEEDLNSLSNFLAEHSGLCSLFIHVPFPGGEKTIRTFTGIDVSDNDIINKLKNNLCVAEVWRK